MAMIYYYWWQPWLSSCGYVYGVIATMMMGTWLLKLLYHSHPKFNLHHYGRDPDKKSSWGHPGAHLGPVGPRWPHIAPMNLAIRGSRLGILCHLICSLHTKFTRITIRVSAWCHFGRKIKLAWSLNFLCHVNGKVSLHIFWKFGRDVALRFDFMNCWNNVSLHCHGHHMLHVVHVEL